MDAPGHVRDADHHRSQLARRERRVAADVAESLHRHPGALVGDAALGSCGRQKADQPATRGLAPRDRSAQGWRLAGHHRRFGVAHLLAVGVHDPGHHLLVGAHVGRRNVLVRSDEVDDLGRVPPGDPLQLGARQGGGIDSNPALGPAERDADNGALPGHQHRQGRHLTEVDVRGEADPTLGRPHGENVLHPVTK